MNQEVDSIAKIQPRHNPAYYVVLIKGDTGIKTEVIVSKVIYTMAKKLGMEVPVINRLQ